MGQERFVSEFCVLKLQRSQGAEFPQTAAAFIVRYCPEGRGSRLERTESAGLSGAAHGTPLFFGRHSAGSGGLVVFSAVFPAVMWNFWIMCRYNKPDDLRSRCRRNHPAHSRNSTNLFLCTWNCFPLFYLWTYIKQSVPSGLRKNFFRLPDGIQTGNGSSVSSYPAGNHLAGSRTELWILWRISSEQGI